MKSSNPGNLPAKKIMMAGIGLFLLVNFSSKTVAQSGQRTLLVLSKGEHTLAIVNATTLKVLAKVPVGNDPHEDIASADGKTAHVTNAGGGRSTEIDVVDLVNAKALPNIDTHPLIGP